MLGTVIFAIVIACLLTAASAQSIVEMATTIDDDILDTNGMRIRFPHVDAP